jgi:hypothetical protein
MIFQFKDTQHAPGSTARPIYDLEKTQKQCVAILDSRSVFESIPNDIKNMQPNVCIRLHHCRSWHTIGFTDRFTGRQKKAFAAPPRDKVRGRPWRRKTLSFCSGWNGWVFYGRLV